MLKWLPVIVWVLVISFLSFSSLENMQVPSFTGFDKIAHIGIYFVLESLFILPLKGKPKDFKVATMLAMLFALATELIQHYFIVNRIGDPWDFLANLIGLLTAFVILRGRIKS